LASLILRRLLLAIPIALAVATLLFVLLETAPGSPADALLGDAPVPPEVRDRVERAYGLDRSPIERYAAWVKGLAVGDLGWSPTLRRPVSRALAEALPPTLLLAGSALILQLALGVFLGWLSAAYRDRWPDRLLGGMSWTIYSLPTFWLGLMAIVVFSSRLGWFPASSMHAVGVEKMSSVGRGLDLVWHLTLPTLVLGLSSAAALTRFVRTGLLDAMSQPFIRAARARGAGLSRLLTGHALRHALLPVVNLLGLSLPILVSGSLVVEVIFGWPGMGSLTYRAIQARDPSLVMAAALISAVLVVIGNLFADVGMLLLDPRIRSKQST